MKLEKEKRIKEKGKKTGGRNEAANAAKPPPHALRGGDAREISAGLITGKVGCCKTDRFEGASDDKLDAVKHSRKRKCNRTRQCRHESQTKNRISRKRMYSSSTIHKCKVVVFSRQCKLGLYLQCTFISGKWLKPAGGRLGPRLTFYVRRRQAAVSNLTPLVYGALNPGDAMSFRT